MKMRIFVAFLIVAVCLTASHATAGDCKKVIANAVTTVYLDPCTYNGVEYMWCIDTTVTGNLKGTWHIFANPDFNGWNLEVPPGIDGIPVWVLSVTWNLSVFETKKGEIITQADEILNPDVYDTYGAISGLALVTGGTGDYEGASGWIGWVVTETGGGVLQGLICTP
jgi:hypothetical protein